MELLDMEACGLTDEDARVLEILMEEGY